MELCEFLHYESGYRPDNQHQLYPYCRFLKLDGGFDSHEKACPCKGDKSKCPFVNIRTDHPS